VQAGRVIIAAEVDGQAPTAALDLLVRVGHRLPGRAAREITVPLDKFLDDAEAVLDCAVAQVMMEASHVASLIAARSAAAARQQQPNGTLVGRGFQGENQVGRSRAGGSAHLGATEP